MARHLRLFLYDPLEMAEYPLKMPGALLSSLSLELQWPGRQQGSELHLSSAFCETGLSASTIHSRSDHGSAFPDKTQLSPFFRESPPQSMSHGGLFLRVYPLPDILPPVADDQCTGMNIVTQLDQTEPNSRH